MALIQLGDSVESSLCQLITTLRRGDDDSRVRPKRRAQHPVCDHIQYMYIYIHIHIYPLSMNRKRARNTTERKTGGKRKKGMIR